MDSTRCGASLSSAGVVAHWSHLLLRCSRTSGRRPTLRFIGGAARFECVRGVPQRVSESVLERQPKLAPSGRQRAGEQPERPRAALDA